MSHKNSVDKSGTTLISVQPSWIKTEQFKMTKPDISLQFLTSFELYCNIS